MDPLSWDPIELIGHIRVISCSFR